MRRASRLRLPLRGTAPTPPHWTCARRSSACRLAPVTAYGRRALRVPRAPDFAADDSVPTTRRELAPIARAWVHICQAASRGWRSTSGWVLRCGRRSCACADPRARTCKCAPSFVSSQRRTRCSGGSGEIRTHEGVAPLPVFKTGAFNHSATLPDRRGPRSSDRRPVHIPRLPALHPFGAPTHSTCECVVGISPRFRPRQPAQAGTKRSCIPVWATRGGALSSFAAGRTSCWSLKFTELHTLEPGPS